MPVACSIRAGRKPGDGAAIDGSLGCIHPRRGTAQHTPGRRTRAGYRYDPPRSWHNRTDIFGVRAAADDELVMGLSVFDTAYRWRVSQRVTLPLWTDLDEWEAYVHAFDAAEALAWLGWTPDH